MIVNIKYNIVDLSVGQVTAQKRKRVW